MIDISTKMGYLRRLAKCGYPYDEVLRAVESAPQWERVKFLRSLGRDIGFVEFIIKLRRYGE